MRTTTRTTKKTFYGTITRWDLRWCGVKVATGLLWKVRTRTSWTSPSRRFRISRNKWEDAVNDVAVDVAGVSRGAGDADADAAGDGDAAGVDSDGRKATKDKEEGHPHHHLHSSSQGPARVAHSRCRTSLVGLWFLLCLRRSCPWTL